MQMFVVSKKVLMQQQQQQQDGEEEIDIDGDSDNDSDTDIRDDEKNVHKGSSYSRDNDALVIVGYVLFEVFTERKRERGEREENAENRKGRSRLLTEGKNIDPHQR